MEDILDALAQAPAFELPIATSGQSRHLARDGAVGTSGLAKKALFDSAIALDGEPHTVRAYAVWRMVMLDEESKQLLAKCCDAASTVRGFSEFKLSVENEVPLDAACYRADLASRNHGSGPDVRRLAAGPSLRGAGLVNALLDALERVPARRLPESEMLSLVDYRLPATFGVVDHQARLHERDPIVHPRMTLRFRVSSPVGRLPQVVETLSFAEAMRGAVLSRYSQLFGRPASKRLAGKREDGAARAGHDHPFFLPLDLENRGVIDAIDVLVPQGCTHDEYLAITRASNVYDGERLRGSFEVEFEGASPAPRGRAWSTATPFILERFPKSRGHTKSSVMESATAQVLRALERDGMTPKSVRVWEAHETILHAGGRETRVGAFRRLRLGELLAYPAVGVTLEFDQPMDGPIVLGRLSHFGLGRFQQVM